MLTILSSETILRYQQSLNVNDRLILEECDPAQIEYMEGGAYDLRIGEMFDVLDASGSHPVFIGTQTRVTPRIQPCDAVLYKDAPTFCLYPSARYLATTMETVRIPSYCRGHVVTRTTLFRCGVLLTCSDAAPGYVGRLTFGLHNLLGELVRIEKGARIAAMTWVKMDDVEACQYRGVWQGGRVSTNGKEERPW